MKMHHHPVLHYLIFLFALFILAPWKTYAGQSPVHPTTGSGAYRASYLGCAFDLRAIPIASGFDGAVRAARELYDAQYLAKAYKEVKHRPHYIINRSGDGSVPLPSHFEYPETR